MTATSRADGPVRPVVLTVAGTDPCGGAGVLADVRAIGRHGAHACAVVAAVTAQNTRAVAAVRAVPTALVRRQLETLLADVPVRAVKVGLLGDEGNVRAVAEVLATLDVPVVIDPVLRATTGRRLAGGRVLAAMRALLVPLATVVTPNAHEAGALLDAPAPRTVDECDAAARALVARGARAALVTGGHVAEDAERCVDVLATPDAVRRLRVARVRGGPVRGTGCLLSSTIAARLAHGDALADACEAAQRWVAACIARAEAIGGGARVVP